MDAFDREVAILRESRGWSEAMARHFLIGRGGDERQARRTMTEIERQREAGPAPNGGGAVTESSVALSVAETEVRQAARSTLGMTDSEAGTYAQRQREKAVREHGPEGARVYLHQLRESIGRAR